MMRMLNLRTSCALIQLRHTGSSSQVAAQLVNSTLCSGVSEKDNHKDIQEPEKNNSFQKPRGTLVSAVFEQLKTMTDAVEVHDATHLMISEAKDKEELLSIVNQKKLTRSHALKLVSVLADWTVEGRIQTTAFETDPRFFIVCRVLGSNPMAIEKSKKNSSKNTSTDLVTVLGVASDVEAAKLISNINLQQMIKVLSTLASKKRRSTALLRSLAFNIASSTEKLDIKQGADALYAVAFLNYHDDMLLERICSDLCACLMANSRRAVVGSIITSLGLLKYKHVDLLDMLSDWVEKHLDTCNASDLSSLIMTLAVVNHKPSNQDTLFPVLLKQLQTSGLPNPHEWLDVVWALTVLNKQTLEQVESVLSPSFADNIRTISPEGLPVPTKLKLLNINGVAKLRLKDYKGPLLDLMSEEWKMPLLRSKEKLALVTSMQETMLNLLPSAVYLNTNVETDMGFMIDAECAMTPSLKPLPLFDKKSKTPIDRSSPDTQKGIKVAIMVLDFHDMTRGRRDPTGINVLCQELTQLKGYRVMTVDYMDFNPRNKLVENVQYLNQQLKALMGKS